MGRSKIILSKEELYRLYHVENKSPHAIGDMLGCSFSTITNRLKELGIPFKTPAFARMRYRKFDFSGNTAEKAYLIGFRLGDLKVYKASQSSETIVVSSHTTCREQVELFEAILGKYGRITTSNNLPGHYYSNCYLNRTFDFLLPKADLVEEWIFADKEPMAAFAAGYIDAEGTFGVYQGRGRFKIDSYDKEILGKIHAWLQQAGVISKFFRVQLEGDFLSGFRMNKDVWRVNVNGASDLVVFIKLIEPFSKHEKRRMDMGKVLKNIEMRKLKGSIK